jgi:hypothetical protein
LRQQRPSVLAKKTTTTIPTTRNYKRTRNHNHDAVVVKVMASSAGDGGPNEVFSAASLFSPISFCLRVCVVLNRNSRGAFRRRRRRRNRFGSLLAKARGPRRSVVFFFISFLFHSVARARADKRRASPLKINDID